MQWLHRFFSSPDLERLAKKLGGEHDVGSFFRRESVRFTRAEWPMTIDFTRTSVTSMSSDERDPSYLRVRLAFTPLANFEFVIRPPTLSGKLVDFALGIPRVGRISGGFDSLFAVWASDENRIRAVLEDADLRSTIIGVTALDALYIQGANDSGAPATLTLVLRSREKSTECVNEAVGALLAMLAALQTRELAQ